VAKFKLPQLTNAAYDMWYSCWAVASILSSVNVASCSFSQRQMTSVWSQNTSRTAMPQSVFLRQVRGSVRLWTEIRLGDTMELTVSLCVVVSPLILKLLLNKCPK